MANVGTVQSVTGTVRAIAEDGSERILSVGDTVAENEKIITGDGVIVIAFTDGTIMDLGSNSSIVLNDDVLNQEGAQTAQSRESANDEVAALQDALTNPNFDPTADLPATAAGAPAAGGTGNNGHTVVNVDYLNPDAAVEAGFDTLGINQEFLQANEELPPVLDEPPVVSVSVEVEVQIDVEDPNAIPPTDGVPTGEFPVVVSGNGASVLEGTSEGTKPVVFIISLDKVFATDVQVTYQLSPLSASNPEDWFDGDPIQTVTIPAGQTTFEVTVNIVEDHIVEGNESFEIMLINAEGATINPDADSAVITIYDDDTAPEANDDAYTTDEGVTLNIPVSGLLVNDTDEDGDALSAISNTAPSNGSVTLNADGSFTYIPNDGFSGQDSFEYTITDGYNAPSTATVNLTVNPGDTPPPPPPELEPLIIQVFTLQGEEQESRITEDLGGMQWVDGIGFIAPTNEVPEFFKGSEYVAFAVDGSGTVIPSVTGTVDITFGGGTATAIDDYDATTQAGVSLGSVFFTSIVDDSIAENDENFVISAGNFSNEVAYSKVSYISAGTTILDNDSVSYAITKSSEVAETDGTFTVTYTITQTGDLATGVTAKVDYATTEGTAKDGSDFTGVTGGKTFTGTSDGAQQTFTVTILGDDIAENTEAYTVGLTANATGDITPTITAPTVTTTITDDDSVPTIGDDSVSISEEGLATGNPDTTGAPDTTNDASVTGSLAITLNGDVPLTVELSDSGLPTGWSSDGSDVTFDYGDNNAVIEGTNEAGDVVVQITLNGGSTAIDLAGSPTSVSYEVELLGQLDHAEGDNIEDALSLNIGVVISDGVNTPVDTGVIAVSIEDDMPVVVAPADVGELQNTVLANVGDTDASADITATASLGVKVGADIDGATIKISDAYADETDDGIAPKDGVTNYVINSTNNEVVTSGTAKLIYATITDDDGNDSLIAYAEGDVNQTAVLAITPTINADGTTSYSTTVYGEVDKQVETSTETFVFNGVNPSPGNYDDLTLTLNDVTDVTNTMTVVITSQADADGSSDGVITDTSSIESVNVSGQRIGVDNNQILNTSNGQEDGDGQSVTFEFDQDVESVSIELAQFGGADEMEWAVSGGTTSLVGTITGGLGNENQEGNDDVIQISDSPDINGNSGDGFTTVSSTTDYDTFDTLVLKAEEGDGYGVLFGNLSVTLSETSDVPIVLELDAAVTDGDDDTITQTLTVTLDGDATLTGSADADIIVGSDADETLIGNEGDDVLIAGAGADTLDGGAGDDTLEGGAGADTLDGGADTDTVSYESDTVGVDVNLTDTDNLTEGAQQEATGVGSDAEGDTISNFENVTGGSGDDELTGDAAANILVGGSGEDVLDGGAGEDTLTGGNDSDEFVFTSTDGVADTVMDFDNDNVDSNDDVLVVTDILDTGDAVNITGIDSDGDNDDSNIAINEADTTITDVAVVLNATVTEVDIVTIDTPVS